MGVGAAVNILKVGDLEARKLQFSPTLEKSQIHLLTAISNIFPLNLMHLIFCLNCIIQKHDYGRLYFF